MELSAEYYVSIKGGDVVQLWRYDKFSDISNFSYEGRKGIIQGKEDKLREEMSRHKQVQRSWGGAQLVHSSTAGSLIFLELGYNT